MIILTYKVTENVIKWKFFKKMTCNMTKQYKYNDKVILSMHKYRNISVYISNYDSKILQTQVNFYRNKIGSIENNKNNLWLVI